ncbi:MAG TPA: cyclase [Bauldia sp.]|nr:cyclase [Bauldia sp.]
MATMFVRHTVSDYRAWRKIYDDFGSNLPKMGVTGQAVYQSAENPNDVTVTHEFPSVAAAQAFAINPDLKKAMQAAGVLGAPTIWFATRA